jgi:hypothetical protein
MTSGHNKEFRMQNVVLLAIVSAITLLILEGCGKPPDTDVTSSAQYGFAPFAGTVWKTKVKLAVAELQHDTYLLPPKAFDAKHPSYTPPSSLKTYTEVPVGAVVQVDRLMKDNGNWGGLRVTATVDDGAHPKRTVYLEESLLVKNGCLVPGDSSSKTWDVAPDFLGK